MQLYDAQHIPLAINIQLDQLEKLLPFLSKDVLYITACGKGRGRSNQGADLFQSAGYNSNWLCGGTFGWTEKES